MKILVLIMMLAVSNISLAKQEDESAQKYDLGKVVVTATKTENYEGQIGSYVTVISGEDLKNSGKATVQELLRYVPGLTIAQNSGFGGSASIYIRGSKPGHTLVMIDGVEVNDPMATDRSFDFAHLTVDNIDRVEIVRGSQSTLYGSDAIGGVINVITKKGEGKPKFEISSEAGSYYTFRESIAASGKQDALDYSVAFNRLDSNGISKARGGSEKDGYENTTLSGNFGYDIFDKARLNFYGRSTYSVTDIDDGAYDDDPNYTAWYDYSASKIEFTHNLMPWWDSKLASSYAGTKRKYRDEKDDESLTEDTQSWYKGNTRKFEWQNNFSPVNWDILTCGFEYEDERGSSFSRDVLWGNSRFDRKTVNNKGYYLQNQFKFFDSLFITPGIRTDDHQLFGTQVTYKLSNLYLVEPLGTKFKANWATGFKAPSLYQLYSTQDFGGGPIGDQNLKPDKSKTYDVGIEQNLFGNKAVFGLNYFDNKFKNMVDYDLTANKYKNIGRAETKGVELEAKIKPYEVITLGASYTYTRTKDNDKGKKLARRPENQTGLNVNWLFAKGANLNLAAKYVGHNWSNPENTQKVEPYAKVDLSATYDITESLGVFGRADNLFDREYEEVRGYATPGRSFYAGSKVKF